MSNNLALRIVFGANVHLTLPKKLDWGLSIYFGKDGSYIFVLGEDLPGLVMVKPITGDRFYVAPEQYAEEW